MKNIALNQSNSCQKNKAVIEFRCGATKYEFKFFVNNVFLNFWLFSNIFYGLVWFGLLLLGFMAYQPFVGYLTPNPFLCK